MDGAMQTLRHKDALRLANRGWRACEPASARRTDKRPDSIGALGTTRAFVAQGCSAALESVRTAIREKLRM
jgi:hypothetical protein